MEQEAYLVFFGVKSDRFDVKLRRFGVTVVVGNESTDSRASSGMAHVMTSSRIGEMHEMESFIFAKRLV